MGKTATIIVFEEDQYNSMFRILFADILSLPDVYSVVEKSFPEQRPYEYLQSRKLKKLTYGLSDLLYLTYYRLPQEVKRLSQSYERINILFHNASLRKTRYPLAVFSFMKKYPVTLNCIYLDVRDRVNVCGYANMLCEKKVFDRVFTFDPNDAKKHNMELCFTPYSRINVERVEENSQLYFCGTDAGRMYLLYQLWQNARRKSIAVKFDLVGCQQFKQFFEEDSKVYFHEAHVKYPQLLVEMQKSSCILDVTQYGQAGFTLRPYEAVVYNKKLLTNNKRIFEFQFYDERYMRYFEKIDDIDWEWLKEPANVDYGYNGEFSPNILLQKLGQTC